MVFNFDILICILNSEAKNKIWIKIDLNIILNTQENDKIIVFNG